MYLLIAHLQFLVNVYIWQIWQTYVNFTKYSKFTTSYGLFLTDGGINRISQFSVHIL